MTLLRTNYTFKLTEQLSKYLYYEYFVVPFETKPTESCIVVKGLTRHFNFCVSKLFYSKFNHHKGDFFGVFSISIRIINT